MWDKKVHFRHVKLFSKSVYDVFVRLKKKSYDFDSVLKRARDTCLVYLYICAITINTYASAFFQCDIFRGFVSYCVIFHIFLSGNALVFFFCSFNKIRLLHIQYVFFFHRGITCDLV